MVLKKRQDHISTDSPSRMETPKWWRVVRRVFFYGIMLPVFVCCLGILFCNYLISKYSEGKVFGDTTFIPYNKVGLLLGTSPRVSQVKLRIY